MKLDEILTKFGGEVIQRPSIDNSKEFEYRGYKATFTLNDDDVYEITYSPTLLRKIERMYSRCRNKSQCNDLAHAAETQASGQAAQSGRTALDNPGGPLERSNG